MEFMQALASHIRFNRMISSYILQPDHHLDASLVGAAEQCELGRWINGPGQQYAAMPEFAALVSNHARYHRVAAEIIQRAECGQAKVEETNLGSTSEFAQASTGIVRALMYLHGKISTTGAQHA